MIDGGLANLVPIPIYVFDFGLGRNAWVNAAHRQTFGADLSFASAAEIAEAVHPDDRGALAAVAARLARLPDGEWLAWEYRVRLADGRWGWFRDRVVVVERTTQGGLARILGATIDVTERKLVEEQLRTSEARYARAEEIGRTGHWRREFPGDGFEWSPGAYRLFGVTPECFTPSYAGFLGLVHPEDREPLKKTVEETLSRGMPLDTLYRIERPDGEERIIRSVAEVGRTDDGGSCLEGAVQDITERVRVEKDRERLLAEVRGLIRRLGETAECERLALARELHDGVGQKIAALSARLGYVRDRLEDSVGAEDLSDVFVSALELVQEIGSDLRTVMADLRPPTLDDYGLRAALVVWGDSFTASTGVEVEVHALETSPRPPSAVEFALFRIAQQALTNVAMHAATDRATIGLEIDSAVTRMVITDDGAGFDPAAVSRDSEPSRWGLIIMRERAEAIGAAFQVEAAPGQGTRIVVEVPK